MERHGSTRPHRSDEGPHPGHRPAAARIVALVLGATLALTACEYSEIDGVGTRTGDPDHPPQLDLATFDGCERGDLGQWRVSAELINHSPTTASYELTVAFRAGDTRVDERSVWIRDLRPGERASVEHGWWIDQADRVTDCVPLTVNRFG